MVSDKKLKKLSFGERLFGVGITSTSRNIDRVLNSKYGGYSAKDPKYKRRKNGKR